LLLFFKKEALFYPFLFLVAFSLNILLGLKGWPAVLAGSLNDPDSYMRLLRIEQGIRAGHLVIVVARDDSGAGVMVEWSRLLDILLWLMAAPLALFIGWHKALFAAGVALGPLSVGALGAILAWAVEPFAARAYLWSAPLAAALLPGMLTFAAPGVVHYHILLLALIALTAGFAARAWVDDRGTAFLTGVSGAFAIWLTPETMPFILMCFAALMLRWAWVRIGAVLVYCAAGFFDVLTLALAFDPPEGGYMDPEIDRLSVVYLILAMLLLAGTAILWRYESRFTRWRAPFGLGFMAVLLGIWIVVFPKVAMGPYGIMSADAMLFALYKCGAGRGRWGWLYLAACTLVTLVLGEKFILFVGFPTGVAAALLPIALSDVSRLPGANAAMLGRLAVLAAVLGLPELAALTPEAKAAPAAPGKAYPSCSLRHIAPLAAPAAGKIVLAVADATPELLYRTQVETVGSLYQHGVPAYLRDRDAWRAPVTNRIALSATGASYVLFCPTASRYLPVADLPMTTLWDVLEAGKPPGWLTFIGQNSDGWELYRVISVDKGGVFHVKHLVKMGL
jgi:hypothetical protein